MTCKNCWEKIVSFILTSMLGILAVSLLQKENLSNKKQVTLTPRNKIIYSEKGSGASGSHSPEINCFPCLDGRFDATVNKKSPKKLSSEIGKLKIISKPIAKYTDTARQNQIQGKVILRIIFLADGRIGSVSPVVGLPDGLTEQAITAARQIKFKPAISNGKPISIAKLIEYNFTIY